MSAVVSGTHSGSLLCGQTPRLYGRRGGYKGARARQYCPPNDGDNGGYGDNNNNNTYIKNDNGSRPSFPCLVESINFHLHSINRVADYKNGLFGGLVFNYLCLCPALVWLVYSTAALAVTTLSGAERWGEKGGGCPKERAPAAVHYYNHEPKGVRYSAFLVGRDCLILEGGGGVKGRAIERHNYGSHYGILRGRRSSIKLFFSKQRSSELMFQSLVIQSSAY